MVAVICVYLFILYLFIFTELLYDEAGIGGMCVFRNMAVDRTKEMVTGYCSDLSLYYYS